MGLFEKVPRSVAKTAVYQGAMALITFAVAFLFTGRLDASAGIAAVNNGSKSVIYYFHERAWARVGWGYSRKSRD
jgi:uncharacterized membrane protein